MFGGLLGKLGGGAKPQQQMYPQQQVVYQQQPPKKSGMGAGGMLAAGSYCVCLLSWRWLMGVGLQVVQGYLEAFCLRMLSMTTTMVSFTYISCR